MEKRRAWLVLSLGAEREYAGNDGYADELESVYRYDSKVPNSKQIAEGDLLVLRDSDLVLGTARVSRIEIYEGHKTLSRCPDCNTTVIKARKDKRPRYRCRSEHEFHKPLTERKPCNLFSAYFDGTFRPLTEPIPVAQVRQACPRYNGQLAMQELTMSQLDGRAKISLQGASALSMARHGVGLFAADADDSPYVVDGSDERKVIARQLRERRGQKTFRQALLLRFARRCLVTGCGLPDLLEAAHISPYRGVKDNHVSNGLLLRTDIHTLFDLDLLGIEPTTLRIHLNPKLEGSDYVRFRNERLACDVSALSKSALESRWKIFRSLLPRELGSTGP